MTARRWAVGGRPRPPFSSSRCSTGQTWISAPSDCLLPVNELVPGSILQTARTDYTILGGVADDVEIHMA